MKYCLPAREAVPLAAKVFRSVFPDPAFADRFLENLRAAAGD